MNNNTTIVSTICSVNRTADSSVPDQDDLLKKIDDAIAWINIFRAHLVLLKAKIANEKEKKKTKQIRSNIEDCTTVNVTFNNQVLELWTSVQNIKINFMNETNKLFNVLASEVMGYQEIGQPLPTNEIESYRKQILELGHQITPMTILQLEIAEDEKMHQLRLVEKQRQLINLIAGVGDKMDESESRTHPREIQKKNERLMKLKICRCVINSILVSSNIDLVSNPNLVDVRLRWRQPISMKTKTLG